MLRLLPILLLFLIALDACQPTAVTSEAQATYAAAFATVALEETYISASLVAREADISGTAYAAETYVMLHNSLNQQLLATVRVGNPPTRQVIALNPGGAFQATTTPMPGELTGSEAVEPDAVAVPNAPDASSQFADTTTARTLRQSDGCAQDATTSFTTADAQIYVVTRALQVSAGTQMEVEWRYEDSVIDSATYTVPTDEQDFCIYFFLDAFSAGSWSVTLTANGSPVSSPVAFTVTE